MRDTSRVELKISGTIQKIPKSTGDVFKKWCELNNVHPLGSARRGWHVDIEEYIGNSDYVFHFDMGGSILLSQSEVDEMKVIK